MPDPAHIIDGTAIAAEARREVKGRVAHLRSLGKPVRLVAMLFGSPPGAQIYAQRQGEACAEVGIDYELKQLPADITQADAEAELFTLNDDPDVTGIMVHLPLPPALDHYALQGHIRVTKDVEGVTPANIGHVVYGRTLIAPCTALAAYELVRSTGIDLRGAEATVVGASEIAGKPVSLLLTQAEATVTICHKLTRDLIAHTSKADILIVAAGYPNLIGPDHVREGAVVIDIGINRVMTFDGKKKTVGDVDFDRVQHKAGRITPVPGGVGPMTVAMLLRNTVRAAELAAGIEKPWFSNADVGAT
ncbi:MAG: bifunctional 5,10-methylenetetrahydrofolate dehydrogenase/5,10-methenyltetrahydrofolate cyclohydrolase [Planctomycetota bacterium]